MQRSNNLASLSPQACLTPTGPARQKMSTSLQPDEASSDFLPRVVNGIEQHLHAMEEENDNDP
jgi:hypothetical protein